MSLCAPVASGADTWADIVTWANVNENWIVQHVDMTEGVLSRARFPHTVVEPASKYPRYTEVLTVLYHRSDEA